MPIFHYWCHFRRDRKSFDDKNRHRSAVYCDVHYDFYHAKSEEVSINQLRLG
ncbi:hypothetical protein [Solibacillus sp. R5-41]|uniref:hypothetical protein n=1 Tax=Solibacillus sp. R5-41 TaxID=2048654 RepID=UPI0012FE03AA|nr:hypothetical protein [Solibacillus sp. R5-41]